MSQTRTIRWVLYHEPIDLFIRTAEAFSEEINRLTNGTINVEIYSTTEFANKFKKGIDVEPLVWMQAGDCEMSQVQISEIANWHSPDFWALELPFLFRDHDHATRALEGPVGQSMLQGLEKTSPARGLAFTYSGGYRCLAVDREINTVEDLKGLSVITHKNPITIETAEAFGLNAVPVHIKDRHSIEKRSETNHNGNNAVETTLPRYEKEAKSDAHRYVVNTKHNMYLTSIIIAKEFWNSLTQEDQAVIQQAALHSSRLEREWSVADADKIANSADKQAKLGIHYNEFDEAERAKLKALVEPLYAKYSQFFTPDLVDGIIKS
jgi:TRAP-type C4-dicarboxylate transport system substrate-binding protein